MLTRCQRMILGIAIGDAYGAGFEFKFRSLKKYRKIQLIQYEKHGLGEIPLGMYTDDTQMSLAICEWLLSSKDFNEKNLADFFVKTFKRDNISGYAKGFQAFLESVNSGQEFLEKIKPFSKRNGAAMRAVPIGLFKDINEVIENAVKNANVTHKTSKGVASSIVVSLISHYTFYYQRMPDLEKEIIPYIKNIDLETVEYLRAVDKLVEFDSLTLFGEKYKDRGVPCDGMRTVGAVWYVLKNFSNPADVLIESVRLGGDTDSIASISLGICLMNNFLSDLPDFLVKDLTNHKYGKDYLINLGLKLSVRFE